MMEQAQIAKAANSNVPHAHQLHHVLPAKVIVKDLHALVHHHIMKMEFQLSAQVVHSDALPVHHQQSALVV